MPRPLTLTGITVHTKSITVEVTSSNDVPMENEIVYKWFRDNQCYQYHITLDILILGQGKNLQKLKFLLS